jgi:hypothetical protein
MRRRKFPLLYEDTRNSSLRGICLSILSLKSGSPYCSKATVASFVACCNDSSALTESCFIVASPFQALLLRYQTTGCSSETQEHQPPLRRT